MAESTKPTIEAERYFTSARQNFMWVYFQDKDLEDRVRDLTTGLAHLSGGLIQLSIGLRATYMLLEQVQSQLQRPRT